jgi:energy-coupling factor transporter transmembrane protein EcfT
MKIDEKIYKRITFVIITLFIFSFIFLVFNLTFTGSNIFNMIIVSIIAGLMLNGIVTDIFSSRHLNNITYFQRIFISLLFFLVILLSIFSYKSTYFINDYKAKYDLIELEKNNFKTKLDKTEKELDDTKLKYNRGLLDNIRDKENKRNSISSIDDFIKKNKTEKPKSTGGYRIGAICCDGTRSYATGRGACSWHGGVCEWLYSK